MAKQTTVSAGTLDDFLKSLLVLSRTIDYVLESRATQSAIGRPLSSSKIQILRLLAKRKGQTSTQVARFLGVTKPAVSQIVDSMVQAKMVVRKPTKTDRRVVLLELTAQGKTYYKAIRRKQHRILRLVNRNGRRTSFKRWSEDLKTISASIAQADNVFEGFCLQCEAHEDARCVFEGSDRTCTYLSNGKS